MKSALLFRVQSAALCSQFLSTGGFLTKKGVTMLKRFLLILVCGGLACAGLSSCGGEKSSILVTGSDTMVNVAQAWAEVYAQKTGVRIDTSPSLFSLVIRCSRLCLNLQAEYFN